MNIKNKNFPLYYFIQTFLAVMSIILGYKMNSIFYFFEFYNNSHKLFQNF